MKEYEKNTLKSYRGSAFMESDASSINLSRLRRAVQQSLSGIDMVHMPDPNDILKSSNNDIQSQSTSPSATTPVKDKDSDSLNKNKNQP